jgi:hypothetical protein
MTVTNSKYQNLLADDHPLSVVFDYMFKIFVANILFWVSTFTKIPKTSHTAMANSFQGSLRGQDFENTKLNMIVS